MIHSRNQPFWGVFKRHEIAVSWSGFVSLSRCRLCRLCIHELHGATSRWPVSSSQLSFEHFLIHVRRRRRFGGIVAFAIRWLWCCIPGAPDGCTADNCLMFLVIWSLHFVVDWWVRFQEFRRDVLDVHCCWFPNIDLAVSRCVHQDCHCWFSACFSCMISSISLWASSWFSFITDLAVHWFVSCISARHIRSDQCHGCSVHLLFHVVVAFCPRVVIVWCMQCVRCYAYRVSVRLAVSQFVFAIQVSICVWVEPVFSTYVSTILHKRGMEVDLLKQF